MTRQAFNPASDPYWPHQAEYDPQIRVMPTAARIWATGTGKTRSDLEDTAWLWCNDKIDAALVVAPIEVHRRTWVNTQGPRWLRVDGARLYAYRSKSSASADEWRELMGAADYDGLKVMVMYFEALASKSGYEFLKSFIANCGRSKATVDESHRIMSPGSLAATRLAAIRDKTDYRRIATATPTANGLEDLYSQFRFLDPSIMDASTFAEYKGMFVNEVQMEGTHFKKIVGYRNVKYLNKRMAPYVFVAKDPPGMPKQFWNKVPAALSDEQWKAYREMKGDYQTQLRNGLWVGSELSIVRLKRLQQIVAGHLPVPDPENERRVLEILPLECPRIQTAVDTVRGCAHKVILWAQEHYEIERLYTALLLAGVGAALYYGKIKKGVARDENIDRFEEDPNTKVLVANDAIGGTGLTIVGRVPCMPVRDQVYYSHTWSRILRIQCEGRNKRVENESREITYHDIMAYGTTDVRIWARRNQKDDIAKMVEDPREIAKLLDDDLDYVNDDGTLLNI